MSEQLLSPTFLFRFCVPCPYREFRWSKSGLQLDEACRMPSFGAQLERLPQLADVRMAWNESGLALTVRVAGKKQSPWCRGDRCEDSDGLQIWLDTRDTHNIHRATRFCHRLVFLPFGRGRQFDQPVAGQLLINRARENPKPIETGVLQVHSEKRIDGYVLMGHIPAAALTGFDATEHPRLGFFYAVQDRELGLQTLSVGREFPFDEDPSVWGTLELATL